MKISFVPKIQQYLLMNLLVCHLLSQQDIHAYFIWVLKRVWEYKQQKTIRIFLILHTCSSKGLSTLNCLLCIALSRINKYIQLHDAHEYKEAAQFFLDFYFSHMKPGMLNMMPTASSRKNVLESKNNKSETFKESMIDWGRGRGSENEVTETQ